MRSLTAALIGAGGLLLGVALLLRHGAPSEAPSVTGGGVAPGNAARAPAAPHAGRVEERLARLRVEFEERRAAAGQPAPNKRDVPAGRAAKATGQVPDQLDAADAQQLSELERTLRHDPDPDERIGAILLLSGSEGPESMHLLADATADPDPEVRLAAVEAMGDRADELSPNALMKPLSDTDAEVRFEAVSILGDMESPDALQLVKTALQDPDDDVRALAEGILDFADEQEGATGAKRPVD